jgi:hydrogenase nickel incorporation protein HypA/HybF
MHELAITQEVVEIVCAKARDRKIRRVVLEIGKLSAVLPDAIQFCFDLCAAGTLAEGARLEILEPDGRARCRSCSAEVILDRPFGRCRCGSTDLEWVSGEELRVKELEVS